MKKLIMLAVAVIAAMPLIADTETVGGYTWTYHVINGDAVEIYNGSSAAISPKPTGAVTITSTLGGKPVTVSRTWLAERTQRAATDDAANGRQVWQCYVLGLDPERADDDFRITRFWMDGNVPMFEFSHTADGSGKTLVPRIRKMGSATPTGPWQEVPSAGIPAYRFFKAEVALP